MIKMISERLKDYNANTFMNEMFETSKLLGMLEAKVSDYHFNSILIPMFRNREVISTMLIEGTQTTISDAFESKISISKKSADKVIKEINNHTEAIIFGSEYLINMDFTDELMKKLHEIIMKDIVPEKKRYSIGEYKKKDNYIVNSVGTVVFTPPSFEETPKYMKDLLRFMNDFRDDINPLIKAAIIHSQFETIHPFEDGNGRVGRLLISLYLYKAKVINFPFFYISEAISQDKAIYYSRLTDTRINTYDEWIKFFLKKCSVQAQNLIAYIDSLNTLYEKTKSVVRDLVNSPKFDVLIECIFTQPVVTVQYLADQLNVTPGQARRYVEKLEAHQILIGDDRQRSRKYYFVELLDLAKR